jgi:hypothetical protein
MSALYLGLCFSSSHKKEMSSFLGLGSSRSRHSGCFYGCTHLGVFQNSVSMEPLVDILSIGFIVLFGNSLWK